MASFGAQASSSTPRCVYDIFLSFRGEDTRKNFTDHLYLALSKAGYHTFRDDDGIARGENIESELQKAIEQSRISIIVISKTYAASRWCLDELVNILHRKKAHGQHVLPIFYDVDPSDVRKQTGSFAEAFTRHEKRLEAKTEGKKKVEHWREALKDVADLGGMVLQNQSNGYEANFIQKIVAVVGGKLNRRVLSISPFLIGIHPRVRYINVWLQDESMDVSVIAICGIGGIGKTTLAKSVYNLNKEKFDASCFLAKIRERSREPNGLVNLQKQFLSDIGIEENVSCVDEGIIKIAKVICCKRLLLVLDDVDRVEQLNAIFGMRHLFCHGSKVILTTRHEWLLNPREAFKVHRVDPLSHKESLELFSWHAFGQAYPNEDYFEQSIKVVQHCRGLPLALKILGSSLSGKMVNVWESALDKLEAIPDSQILEKLKISYDSLQDDHDKNLFLHIACFFNGWDRDVIVTILDQCDFFTTIGIQNLMDRCLLTVDEGNKLIIHKMIQDMGREIVRQESPKKPGLRSRLWHHKDCFNVLREKTGTCTIEGLVLNMHTFSTKYEETLDNSFPSDQQNSWKRYFRQFFNSSSTSLGNSRMSKFVETDAFSKMSDLQLLQLNYVQITGHFYSFPTSIRWLCWHGFPLTTIPNDFPMEHLVVLDMRYSNLKIVWKGTMILKTLKILDLSHSERLIETPDLSGVPNLERFILEDCVNLVEIHESIQKVERLVLLNLKDCTNLKKLPRSICTLKCLEALIISGCLNLDWWPKEHCMESSLKVLHDDGNSLKQSAFKEVKSWLALILTSVLMPQKSPKSSYNVLPSSLVMLSLADCDLSNDGFPLDLSNLSSLEYLDLSSNKFYSLPESIKGLTRLHTLDVSRCRMLTLLTGVPNVKLKKLIVSGCISLKKISFSHPDLSKSFKFSSWDCDMLSKVEDHKFERIDGVDTDKLKTWGFFNLESLLMKYILMSPFGYTSELALQRLSERGLYSYFLLGDKIPSVFDIRSKQGPKLSFIVPPPPVHCKITGIVVCSVYKTRTKYRSSLCLMDLLFTEVKNNTKNVEFKHIPVCYGLPKTNEYMIWVSHWNFVDLFDAGDEMHVSVGVNFLSFKYVVNFL